MKRFMGMFMLGLFLVLSACTDDSDVEPESDSDEGAAESGGDLVISTASDLVSLDPHGSNDLPSDKVRNTIYDGLVAHNDELGIEPLLASDWEQTDDTTWVFNLREDVTFHDGSAFNAEVVKANLDRILDPAIASPRVNIFEMIEEVNVLDEHRVEIVTAYPFAPMLNHLAHDGGGMISKEVIDEDYQYAIEEAGLDMTVEELYEMRESDPEAYEGVSDDISENLHAIVEQNPVGTGYLMFVDRTPGERTELARFDDFLEEPAKLDTVTFKVVSETGSRIAELETGDSHVVAGFEPSSVERIENNEETNMYTLYNIAMEYIGFNTSKEPLDDRQVRQAISHMVDKEAVIDGIYSSTGRIMDGPLQPEILGYDESIEGLGYDVERAKELMAEAGYEDGFEISIITNDAPERVDLAVFLQEQLREINIEATVDQLEWGAYLEAASSGDHEIFILGWPNSTGDPDNGLWPLFHSSMTGNQGNRSFYENDAVDQLLEEGRRTTEESERAEIYREVQEVLVDEAPMVYLRQAESMNAYRDEVNDLYIDRFNRPDFRNVTLEQ
ncbi:glutathione ABC transporter substrate-binding protein [Salinicoccus luteus]|uniref:glutathione ABC transporter substrate-binding protein n=1 Tax=Salinicoccus luteus TaxID=367840 RepID=UPI0005681701|nr:glutathione ABC transporter substrate-binding protein [Salinicoccus luteus]